MQDTKLKAIGYEFVTGIINVGIIVYSFYLTVSLSGTTELEQIGFLQGAFVFIVPCALEGLNILTSKSGENKTKDIIDVIISLISIVVMFFLFALLIFERIFLVNFFEWIILVYPVKIIANEVFVVANLIKERNRK